ncbi:MAG: 50S ribosomal protein L6 [Candidatus Omnitrophica bacterium]|nr:50S ribosomal protein L6 [Candidatus Omnitrophota bacterium]
MSRIGRLAIPVPQGAKITLEGATVRAEGSKGKLSVTVPGTLSVTMKDSLVHVQRANDLKNVKALHGLYRSLIANMLHGVTQGFVKELEVQGVGYRAQAQPKQLSLTVGFSHPVVVPVPEGLTVETPKPTTIIVKGADRHLVGQLAATIRRVAVPEPYKGKGIRYAGEAVRRKAGKAATGSKGAASA